MRNTHGVGLGALLVLVVAASGCKGDKDKETGGNSAKPVETVDKPATVAAPSLGVESPRLFGYRWGKGNKPFAEAEKMLKAEARDWAKIAETCRAAIAADKGHLGAHRLLGIALAETGDNARASEHLLTALSGDWLRWGPTLPSDKALAKFFETPEGKALLAQNEKYKQEFYAAVDSGPVIVAKRTKWKPSKKTGKQWAATRAELFAYDLESERYLRLTHTGEAVVGFIPSPDGSQIATLRVTHYNFAEGGRAGNIEAASVAVYDKKTLAQIGETARLKKPAPSLALYYAPGEELILDGHGTVYSVDVEGGKLKKSRATGIGDWVKLSFAGSAPQPILYHNADLSRFLEPWGVKSIAANAFQIGDRKVELPKAGGDKIRRIAKRAAPPDGSRSPVSLTRAPRDISRRCT